MKFFIKPIVLIIVLIISQQIWNMIFQDKWLKDVDMSYSSCVSSNSHNIESINFEPINSSKPPIIKKGDYWIKLKRSPKQQRIDHVVTFASHNIKNVNIIHPDTSGLVLAEDVEYGANIIKSQYPSYVLRGNQGDNIYYFHFTATRGMVLNISIKPQSDFINRIVLETLIRGAFYCIILFLCLLSIQNYYRYKIKLFLYRGFLNISFLALLLYYDGSWKMLFEDTINIKYIVPIFFIILIKVAGGLYSKALVGIVSTKSIPSKRGEQVSNMAILLFVCYVVSLDIRFFYAALCTLPLALVLYIREVYKADGSMTIKLMYATPTITILSIYSIHLLQVLITSNIMLASITLIKVSLLLEVVYGHYIQKVIITEKKITPLNIWDKSVKEYNIAFRNIFLKKDFKSGQKKKTSTKVGADLLSRREKEVCILIAQNYKNTEISEKLYISLNTVKFHRRNIYKKLDVRNQSELCKAIKACTNTDQKLTLGIKRG